MEDRVDEDSEMMRSSIASSKFVTTRQAMLKKHEYEMSKKQYLQPIPWCWAGVILSLIPFIVLKLVLDWSFSQCLYDTSEMFNIAFNLIKIDMFLRKTVMITVTQTLSIQSFCQLELQKLPSADVSKPILLLYNTPSESDIKQVYKLHETVTGATEVFDHYANRRALARTKYVEQMAAFSSKSSKMGDYVTSSYLSGLYRPVNLLGSKNQLMTDYASEIKLRVMVDLEGFARNLADRISTSVARLRKVNTYVIGKEPPFNLPLYQTMQIRDLILQDLSLCKDLQEADYMSLIDKIRPALETLKFSLSDGIILLFVGCAGFFMFVSMVWISKNIDTGLFKILTLHRHLKPYEAEHHLNYLSKCLNCIKNHSTAEEKLIMDYLEFRSSIKRINALLLASKELKSKSKKYNKSFNVRPQRNLEIFNDTKFKSSKAIMLSSVVVFIALLAYIGAVLFLWSKTSGIRNIQGFYFDNYSSWSKICEQYMAYLLTANYGNFIKIDGKYPEDILTSSTATYDYVASILRSPSNFAMNDKLNGMLFTSLCPAIPKNVNYKFNSRMCTLTSDQSVLVILNQLNEEYSKLKLVIREQASYRTLLAETREKLVTITDIRTLFTKNFLRARYLFEILYEYLNLELFQEVDSRSASLIWFIDGWLRTLAYVALLFLCTVLIGFFVCAARQVQRELSISRESFETLLPEVYNANKVIQSVKSRWLFTHRLLD